MRDVLELRMQARALGLSAPELYWCIDIGVLSKIYNGYGPDRWPECLRKITTWFYRHFEASASIHDVRYEFSDGTIDGWILADDEFVHNTHIQLAELYPLYNPLYWPFRALACLKIKEAQWCLELAGYTAYNEAHKRHMAKTT